MRYKTLEDEVRICAFERLFRMHNSIYRDPVNAFLYALEVTKNDNKINEDLAEQWKQSKFAPADEITRRRESILRHYQVIPKEPRYRKTGQRYRGPTMSERQEIRDKLIWAERKVGHV